MTPANAKHQQPAPSAPRLLSRDGLLCALLSGVALLLTWPVAEIGINDDWSYIRTAQLFAQTHHFVYNGWATAMLGWQIIWGAFFAWLFGSSFTAVRLSMVPIALLTTLLFHAILRGFGLNRAHAIFGTLVLSLSPIFLALSDTFMSDVPGLFSLLLCLYLCQRAVAARTDIHATWWLVFAGLTNVLSGTVRQISWLGVLVLVPCCGWLLRRRRYIIQATLVTWLVGVISINRLIAWFLRQPYSIPEWGSRGQINALAVQRLLIESWRSSMSTLLFLLPMLVAFAVAVWPARKSHLVRLVSILAALGLLYLALHRLGRSDILDNPWLAGIGNIITPHGVMQDWPLFGSQRQASNGWQLLLAAVVFASLVGSLMVVRSSHRPERSPLQLQNRRTMSVLLLPILIAYCLLIVPRAAFVVIFDRYLLFIMAIVLIYMLSAHQERISPRIPAVACATLVVVAALGIAATHDLFAIDRAEVRLVDELQQAGVPRTEIRAGFDFDSITQVENTGYLNDPHLINPPGSYHPYRGRPDEIPPCGYPYLSYAPSLRTRYVISADPSPCLGPSSFMPQTYRTWLPPATHQIFAGTLLFPDSPNKALSTRP